jgi:hypothetical protein
MSRAPASAAFLLFLGLSSGIVVGPAIYEQDDFGDISLQEFTYSLSADCTAGTITSIVMNESNKPVRDAHTYLKYIDFSAPLISSKTTDKDGLALHKLPGDVKLMRGLFILVIEKTGYRIKEVHFDLYPCFHNGSLPPKPPPPPPKNTTQTKPPVFIVNPPPKNNTTIITVPNITNATNETGNGKPEAGPFACPSLFMPLLLTLLIVNGHLQKGIT